MRNLIVTNLEDLENEQSISVHTESTPKISPLARMLILNSVTFLALLAGAIMLFRLGLIRDVTFAIAGVTFKLQHIAMVALFSGAVAIVALCRRLGVHFPD